MKIALQLELMGVFWGILAILSFQTYAMGEFWFMKYCGYATGAISICYFIASLVKSKRKKDV